jgi:hypothetical protein
MRQSVPLRHDRHHRVDRQVHPVEVLLGAEAEEVEEGAGKMVL